MIQDIKKHSTDYAILAGYLGIMLLLFMLNLGREQIEAAILVTTCLGYVAWGIWHHYQLHNLSSKIVAEYSLMAILIMTVLTAVILNR